MSDENEKESETIDPELQSEADTALADYQESEGITAAPDASQASQPAENDIDTGALCTSVIDVTFNSLIAPKRGKIWQLSQEECKALGDSYGAILDKYFPDLSAGPEVAAVMVTLAVIGPRVLAENAARRDTESEPAADKTAPLDTSGEFKTEGA